MGFAFRGTQKALNLILFLYCEKIIGPEAVSHGEMGGNVWVNAKWTQGNSLHRRWANLRDERCLNPEKSLPERLSLQLNCARSIVQIKHDYLPIREISGIAGSQKGIL